MYIHAGRLISWRCGFLQASSLFVGMICGHSLDLIEAKFVEAFENFHSPIQITIGGLVLSCLHVKLLSQQCR